MSGTFRLNPNMERLVIDQHSIGNQLSTHAIRSQLSLEAYLSLAVLVGGSGGALSISLMGCIGLSNVIGALLRQFGSHSLVYEP